MNLSINTTILNTIPKKPYLKSSSRNYKVLHNIPDVNCAICNQKVIDLVSIAKIFSKISKPLSEMINKGFMKRWEDVPFVWEVLNKFSKKYPNDSLDTIFQQNDKNYIKIRDYFQYHAREEVSVGSAIRAEIMAKRVFKMLMFDSRSELLPASSVLDYCKNFKEYLKGSPLRAYEQLEIYAQKYPDKTLSQIVQTDEVYNKHKKQHELIINELYDKLDYHFNNIIKIVTAEDPLSKNYFNSTEARARDILYSERDINLRLPKIKKQYEGALKFMKCENIHDEVMDEVNQIPTSHPTEDLFFVSAHDENWNDAVILNTILSPFGSTVDHIIPLSKGGKDNIYNTLVMCKSCNNARSSRSYNEYMKIYPEMSDNIQTQIDFIIDGILKCQIQDEALVRWPVLITSQLNRYTNGAINHSIGDYIKPIIELTKEKINIDIPKIEALKKENQEIKRSIRNGENENADLKQKLTDNTIEINKLESWVGKNIRDLQFFENWKSNKSTNTDSIKATTILEEHEDFSDDFSGDCS